MHTTRFTPSEIAAFETDASPDAFAKVVDRDHIRLRVWERGAGLTLACGTGACAALVATARRGLTDRKATVVVDGGELTIDWDEASGHVFMTGPVEIERTGLLPQV